jgi:hypothetical protein
VALFAFQRLDGYPVAKSLETSISGCMEGQSSSPRRTERVVFETDRHVVVGDVTLPEVGYQSRFSDAVNRGDVAFIPLVDVEISLHGGGEVERRPFIVLAKAHIRSAYPLDPSA